MRPLQYSIYTYKQTFKLQEYYFNPIIIQFNEKEHDNLYYIYDIYKYDPKHIYILKFYKIQLYDIIRRQR